MAPLNAVCIRGKHEAKERNSKRHKLFGAHCSSINTVDNLCVALCCQISHWCSEKLCVCVWPAGIVSHGSVECMGRKCHSVVHFKPLLIMIKTCSGPSSVVKSRNRKWRAVYLYTLWCRKTHIGNVYCLPLLGFPSRAFILNQQWKKTKHWYCIFISFSRENED